jgi:hypothetical protein
VNSNDFISIKLSYQNIDRYLVRTGILSAITSNKHLFSGKLIDVGCGIMPYKNFLLNNSDIVNYIGVDLKIIRKLSKRYKTRHLLGWCHFANRRQYTRNCHFNRSFRTCA